LSRGRPFWLAEPHPQYPENFSENKKWSRPAPSWKSLEYIFSGSFRKMNGEYQAAQRRVLGVRPNQRLQAR